jgi:DHA1 family tetracycline resistance protein-like MFS transporter
MARGSKALHSEKRQEHNEQVPVEQAHDKKSSMKRPSPLLVIFLVVFFDLLSFGIVIPILPFYSKEFGANAFVWSWVMAIYSIAQFIFSPFWGGISDRYGRRPVLLISIFFGALATLAMGFATSILWIFVARFLAGVFAANISAATAYIADSTTPETRAKGMGIIGAGFGLGFIFGPALGGLLAPYGLATPILAASVLGMLNFVLAYFILVEPLKDLEARRKNRRRSSLSAAKEALSSGPTRGPILLFFFSTLAFVQLEVSFGFYVADRFGLDAKSAGMLLALMGIVMVLVQGGAIGRLAKRFGEASLIAAGLPIMAIALLASAFAPSVAIFAVCLGFIGFGQAIVNPSLSSLMSRSAKPESLGAMMGVFQSGSSLARIIGPPLAGFLYVQSGTNSPLFLAALLLIFSIIIIFPYLEKRVNAA